MTPTKGKKPTKLREDLKKFLWEYRELCQNPKVNITKATDLKADQLLSLFKKTLDSVRLEEKDETFCLDREYDPITGYNQAVKEQSKLIERALK